MNRANDRDFSVIASKRLWRQWHGVENSRLEYAFTSVCRDLLRGNDARSTRLALSYGAHLQTHLAANRNEIEMVRALFPRRLITPVFTNNAGCS